jgi:hypothetical protein
LIYQGCFIIRETYIAVEVYHFFSLRGLSIIRANISGEGTIFQNTIINHAKDAGKCICIYTTFSTEIILQDHQQYSKDVICHNIGNAKDPVLN